jgi:hypothetical protein
MNLFRRLWNNFKAEADIWFFFGFLLTFPFSIRKVITFYPIRGQFNEYAGIYLYLSDIFLFLTLLSWFIILCNKYNILSMLFLSLFSRLKLWTKSFPQVTPKHFLAYLSLILILWSFLSFFWSESKSLSLFRSLKLLEFYLLAIFVAYQIVPRLPVRRMFHVEHSEAGGTFLKDTLKLVIFGGVLNSIIAIWQFITQHSIGLTFLKESILSPDIGGVAKLVIGGHKLIRAYGFFPHPNILGGFLLLSIALTIYYRQLFHVEQLKISPFGKGGLGGFEKLLKNHHPSNPSILRTSPFSKGRTFLIWLLLIIQIIALILTFSKSAIIGLLIAIIYINVPRGTFGSYLGWDINIDFKQFTKIALFTFFVISATISLSPNLSPIQNQSLEERRILMDNSGASISSLFHACPSVECSTWNIRRRVEQFTFVKKSTLRIGQGQLVWSMRNSETLLDWQFQPVHNVFLLIWSELGIVGLLFFVWILWKMFHPSQIVPRGTIDGAGVEHSENSEILIIFKGIFLGFIFIMLFDHYFWDIQQGQAMLWMVLGLVLGLTLTNKRNSGVI